MPALPLRSQLAGTGLLERSAPLRSPPPPSNRPQPQMPYPNPPFNCRRRKSAVAFVPQSDVLIPSLTVQECLHYSALLRLPRDTSPLDLQLRIERVLDDLGLRHIADAKVGGSGGIRGISGGERRR